MTATFHRCSSLITTFWNISDYGSRCGINTGLLWKDYRWLSINLIGLHRCLSHIPSVVVNDRFFLFFFVFVMTRKTFNNFVLGRASGVLFTVTWLRPLCWTRPEVNNWHPGVVHRKRARGIKTTKKKKSESNQTKCAQKNQYNSRSETIWTPMTFQSF